MVDLLNIVTILCIGPLIGVELAVSVFVNPVIWKLDPLAQSRAIQLFARRLGTAMPLWYVAAMLLLFCETIAHLHQPGVVRLGLAAAIWGAVIVATILFLVPINNRLARMEAGVFTENMRREHRTWETLHRVRVAALAVAMVTFLAGL